MSETKRVDAKIRVKSFQQCLVANSVEGRRELLRATVQDSVK